MHMITKEYAAKIAAGTINMIKCGGGGITNMDIVLVEENGYVIASATDFGLENMVLFFFHQGKPDKKWPDYSITFDPMDMTGFQEDLDIFADYAWLYSCLYHAVELTEHFNDAEQDEEEADRRSLTRTFEMRNFDVAVTASWRKGELFSVSLCQNSKIPQIYSINDTFKDMKKADLVEWADVFGYENASNLKKAELEELIKNELLNAETMFYRIAFLSPGTTAFFDEDRGLGCTVSDKAWDEARLIVNLGYGTMTSEKIYIFGEVRNVWRLIDKEKFRAYQKRASWVWKCLKWTDDMYKYTPAEVFLQVINARQGMRMNEEELYDIFDHFPLDINWTTRYDDYFVDHAVNTNAALDRILEQQNGKSFYIPSPTEVEEFYAKYALISDPAYQKMLHFLTGTKGIKIDDDVEALLTEFWEDYDPSSSTEEDMQWFLERMELEDDSLLERLRKAVAELEDNTRTAINRGHKAIEVTTHLQKGDRPFIATGGTKAAEKQRQGKAESNVAGIKADPASNEAAAPIFLKQADGPVTASQPKIYPNDPCPCGSGKKYKKCCGK